LEGLLRSDGIDAFWPERLAELEGRPVRSVTQGAVDLPKVAGGAPAGEAAGLPP
jgi:molecular chaperone HtpG